MVIVMITLISFSLFTNVTSVWQLKLGEVAERLALLTFGCVQNIQSHDLIICSWKVTILEKGGRMIYKRARIDKTGFL